MTAKVNMAVVGFVLALLIAALCGSVATASSPVVQPLVSTVWSTTEPTSTELFTYTTSPTAVKFQFRNAELAHKYYLAWLCIVLKDGRCVAMPIDKEGFEAGILVDCNPVSGLCTATEITPIVGNADGVSDVISRTRYVFRGSGTPVGVKPFFFRSGSSAAAAAKQQVAKMRSEELSDKGSMTEPKLPQNGTLRVPEEKSDWVIPFAKLPAMAKGALPPILEEGE